MKIIRVKECMADGARFDVDFHPDSALLLPGRPLFYPDFGGDWVARLYLAVHVNRLGKSVSEKFAPRYYDSLSFAIRIMPADASMIADGVLSGLDSSVTHGEWLVPDEFLALTSVTVNGGPVGLAMPDYADVNRAVSQASMNTTLRMGDIIMLPLGSDAISLSPRSRLIIADADRELMNVKIV